MLSWTDPVSFIHDLTAQQRRVLKHLEVKTVGELLSIAPRRYDDYSRTLPIAQIRVGESVTIRARVRELKKLPTFRKRLVIIRGVLEDDTGSLNITWFNQPWMLEQLKPGTEIFVSGTVRNHPRFGRSFTSPIWEPANVETLAAGNIAPVYPLIGQVTQKTLRKIMRIAVDDLNDVLDPLPPEILKTYGLPDFLTAVRYLHTPKTLEAAELGRKRLAFDEVFFYHLALRLARGEADRGGAPSVSFDEKFAKLFSSKLPFELTADQRRAVWAAVKDMESARPMRRLVQGDVGSGKTVVAAFCAALVNRAGFSAVLMAPTELLAKQHFETFRRLLSPFGFSLLLMTSSSRVLAEGGEESALKPLQARERILRGRLIAIGTHALIERGASPPDLALAIVDEQHRFGVAQREALTVLEREDGRVPHLLSMTATPIPRSLALTFFGDLDVSIIKTKPAGRKPVTTKVVVGETGRNLAYQAVLAAAKRGEQSFIVCPLIDPSDVLGSKSVEEESLRLKNGPLKSLRLKTLHGKMSTAEKDEAMGAFKNAEADVVIATTVVEVGVDIPRATVMLIESAERFGLAQLHQLRGRIGRSELGGTCYLIATDDSVDLTRLRVMERTADGFEVAEADFKLRGYGNLLGYEQSGRAMFRYLHPADDLLLMTQARDAATGLIASDPDLADYPKLKIRAEDLRQTAHGE